ncbi:MAG TPA: translation initiation factor IF-2 [Candidatus Nanoarchaeia archaeon]|nr:translation initiation factor IF-2 [Candidatus Nanoarchaeia archaeon]
MMRQPIITVMGHVDHGKTSLLDYIRSSTIVLKEAGAITQSIGASSVPLDVIQKLCGPLLERFKLKFTIPGLLFIDTPGHEAFTNLRRRGGSVADIAIVVIDITQGVQPQTKEAIDLLRSFKVPFIVAANKIDLITGWKSHSPVHIDNFQKQIQLTKEQFEKRFYQLVGQLGQLGFDSDMYNKVDDYAKRLSIVPISAKTGEGIAELLALVAGLAQKYLEDGLKIEVEGPAKGNVLEIKEERGLGITADVILYDGSLRVNDIILVAGIDKVIKTKVKALLRPLPLVEMRAAGRKFEPVTEVHAATGVKIVAPEMENAIAGSPIVSVVDEKKAQEKGEELLKEIEAITLSVTTPGIILKTDALGSLEALSSLLNKKSIPIQRLDIGPINKQDVSQAAANAEKSPLNTFVLGFNVPVDEDARELANKSSVTIIDEKVIYHLIEKLEKAIELKKSEQEKAELLGLVWPAKFRIIPGFVFRQTKPAVFGVEVMAGKLFPRVEFLTADGREIGFVKSIETEGEKLESLEAGRQAALSVDGVTIGRQLKEGDVLYTAISEEHFRKLKAKRNLLKKAELEVMKEIADIKRKEKPTWGL